MFPVVMYIIFLRLRYCVFESHVNVMKLYRSYRIRLKELAIPPAFRKLDHYFAPSSHLVKILQTTHGRAYLAECAFCFPECPGASRAGNRLEGLLLSGLTLALRSDLKTVSSVCDERGWVKKENLPWGLAFENNYAEER